MNYFKRTLEDIIQEISGAFPVLFITGPRQIGKTTLLEHCAGTNRGYVTLDDLRERELARQDPELFFLRHPPPVIIDEVQYAPELFTRIKILCDQQRKPGLFWLTGSQKFHLMDHISESLAGRVAILDLLGLSQEEYLREIPSAQPFLPTPDWLADRRKQLKHPPLALMDLYHKIWRGSFPQLISNPKTDRDLFYASYVQTYIERDVRTMTPSIYEEGFARFLSAAAARSGQLLNYTELARDVDIDQRTAKTWINLLERSGLIYLLQPYHTNVTKRLIKTPKLYFLDSGLCSFLTRWNSPEALEAGMMSGAILETYLFSEILKSYWHRGKRAYFNFYRDKDQREIDLVIEQNNTLYPIEFKKTANPSAQTIKSFKALEGLGKLIGHGAVICLKDHDIPLSREVDIIPVGYL